MTDGETPPGGTKSYPQSPGDETYLHGTNTLQTIKIVLTDGTEFECLLGPNETVRFKAGTMTAHIHILPAEQSLHDPLTVLPDG